MLTLAILEDEKGLSMMAISAIPTEEVHFAPDSFIDPNGRVFEWEGEVYRVLSPIYVPFFRKFFENGVIPALMHDGLLVESEITGYSFQSGDLVLRHRKIPVLSYCYEWPAPMLKAAALHTIDLCIRLADHHLTLQDGHPWNILFDGTKPVFVDMGSINPIRDDVLWAPYQQFCNFFLFPLYLYSAGQDRLVRWLLHDYLEGVTDADVLTSLPLWYKLRHPRRAWRILLPRLLARVVDRLPEDVQRRVWGFSDNVHNGAASTKVRRRFFESLRAEIESIKLPSASTHWRDYYLTGPKTAIDIPPAAWKAKQDIVDQILSRLRPRTVLDLGCNTGYYARLAASHGSRVIACDKDPASVDQCYEEARQHGLNILSLVSDALTPSPAYSRGGAKCPSAVERFQSDCVLALALIHHLVAHQRLDIGRITEALEAFSTGWLLLEFVPPLKPRMGARSVSSVDGYTLETFGDALAQRFKKVAVFDSYPEDRKLFLCEK